MDMEQNQQTQGQQPTATGKPRKDKVAAGVLAILLGGLGIHKFYLGQIGLGIVYLIFCWTGIPTIIGIVEGVIYLTKTQEEWDQQYNV